MLNRSDSAVAIQRRYYTETAQRYETMHAMEGAADPSSMKFAAALLRAANIKSLLEVGTANGRGLRNLKNVCPEAFVCGVEPVAGLLDQAGALGHRAGVSLIQSSGESLPFPDASFDAVCEFSTLHHVPQPALVVKEMLRVARKVVLLADSNRFGQGSTSARWLKLALCKAGLWNSFNFLRTGGKGYMLTEGDGLAYSYSVFDSYDLIAHWARRIILVPSSCGKSPSWLHPLLNSSGVYLFAFREEI